MYGLLLDSIQKFLCERYGERYWDKIRRRANLKNQWFVTHEVYSDEVLPDLVKAAAAELGEDESLVMRMFGEYFAKNIGHYGYARLLRVLGRDLRDFLNGLDDLHEYLRFSYPKMSPPSFFCEKETEEGLILHYTTARKGFLQYVIGQLTTVGRIYGKDLEIQVLSEVKSESSTHFTMKLNFDNSEVLKVDRPRSLDNNFGIDADTFFGVFPFCVLFDKDLLVLRQGTKLQEVLPDLEGEHLTDIFSIRKPSILAQPSFESIRLHANCVFELVSISTVERKTIFPGESSELELEYPAFCPQLKLKGQMMPFPKMEMMAFLCSPVMDSPEDLYESGIFINDLAMYDSSRDVILAGTQRDPELKIALSQEKIRSAQLEESIQQTDRLLFQMIPKPIADKLRNGETPLNTCKEFSSVSILFSDIVSFTPMCSRLHPMEVVCVLNAMYVAFDRLCEIHHVYKVETIGDAYMVLCGAPVCTVHHAEYTANFAMDIIQATSKINDPSTSKSLKIRVGIHSGNVVAGVVGSTVLRYDVFGDTVNVAARMEATGEPMRVHVSEATAQLLTGTPFTLKARGSVEVKGKGRMNTFWVLGKTDPISLLEETSSNMSTQGSPASLSPPVTRKSLANQRPSPPDQLLISSEPPSPFPQRSSQPPYSPPVQSSPKVRRHSSQSPESAHAPQLKPRRASQPPRTFSSTSTLHPQDSGQRGSPQPPSIRPISPRPNQWPQADKQLQRFPSNNPYDHSVPPGGGGVRRNTVPAVITTNMIDQHIKWEDQQQKLKEETEENRQTQDAQVQPPRRLYETTEPPIPVTKAHSNLRHRDSLIHWQIEQSIPRNISLSKIPKVLETKPSLESLPIEWPSEKLPSELNLMDIRGSISGPPPTAYTAQAIQEMEHLVAQTEESALQARRVADNAARMLRQMKNSTPHHHDFPEYMGTPVDVDHNPLCPIMNLHSSPEPEDSSTGQTMPNSQHNCPAGPAVSNGCPVGLPNELKVSNYSNHSPTKLRAEKCVLM